MSVSIKNDPSCSLQQEVIGIVIFPGVVELDFVGPLQVLQGWKRREDGKTPHCILIGSEPEIRCEGTTIVRPQHTFDNCPAIDTLLVPGGPGTRNEAVAPIVADFVRRVSSQVTRILGVCSGTLLLERAGLTQGVPVTSHWRYHEGLKERGNEVVSQRYVKSHTLDGKELWTSAGVSAGMDLALAYIADRASQERAAEVQLDLEYFPSPIRYPLSDQEKRNLPEYVQKLEG